MTSIKDEKSALRALYKEKREAMPREERAVLDRAVCDTLAAASSYRHASVLLGYAPHGAEIDVTPLLRRALAEGKRVALPRSARGGEMTFHYISSLEELAPGLYGIQEPPEGCPAYAGEPASLCLVPAFVFDREGFRIGYGGGYYDRFLRGYGGTAIGVIYRDHVRERLPRGRYDLAVTALATDRGILPIER
ncbi:MAG: 5-formyltetrahydrofolate cyclo-ligase [Clostridia bacterium]|nr:5-formyltetrahydrofolate cyclo-ligase [Clostridia bacterium]